MLRCEQALRLTVDMGLRSRTSTIIAAARPVIGFGVIAAIFFFLGRSLVSNWSDLSAENVNIQPAILVASMLPAAAAIILMAFVWRQIVAYLAGPAQANLGQLPKVFLYSWAGRYVPGKVAYVVGRFVLGRTAGVSGPVLVGSIVYENVLLITTGAAFATLTLLPILAIESESVLPYLALPIVAVGGAVVLHPRVLGWAVRLAARLLGRELPEDGWLLSPRQMARLIALVLVVHLVNGVGFYLLLNSITSYSPRYLPLAAGAFALAGIVGMVSVFAPAGIGVREGILVAVLQTTMPVELAIFVALVARAWSTGIDLLLITGSFLYDQLSGERLLMRALRGRVIEPDTLDP